MSASAIVWFRNDLRLADNPALSAVGSGAAVPVYILEDPEDDDAWPLGAAARWRLHQSLTALARGLEALGSRLILKRGRAVEILPQLAAETGATAAYWNRRYEPAGISRDRVIKAALGRAGVTARSFNGALLFEPWDILTRNGGPYRVFSPYWRACRTAGEPSEPLPAPERLAPPSANVIGDNLSDWNLTPSAPDWAFGFREAWDAGESAAAARIGAFLDSAVDGYAQRRDIPGEEGVSGLSPYLRFGEISPRQVWRAARLKSASDPASAAGVEAFLRELGWREFSYHLLYHFPHLPDRPFNERFDGFGWLDDRDGLAAWRAGRTGFPIVDAGMRQLWRTGWMHNRVRMIAASFLVKDLLVHWREGAAWFWDTLIDADLANNSASWQWVAGCGADAAPFFRIFNPVLQAEKFDPKGDYVRRWVPELAGLSNQFIHRPWEAPKMALATANVRLNETYPRPIVDHSLGRDRALAALGALKR